MESNQGHTSSANYYLKKSNISNIYLIIPSVRSPTSADYWAGPLTQNTTFPKAGISTEASYLAPIKPPGMQLKPENSLKPTATVYPAKTPLAKKRAESFSYYVPQWLQT